MATRKSIKLLNKGYSETGASYTKKALKGFFANSGSPNEDINWNNQTLRERARMLTMSGGLAASAVYTNTTNVIGCGLQLKSRVDFEYLGWSEQDAINWQKNVEREWALWAENKRACDAMGMNDFYSLQKIAFTSAFTSGDCFALFKQYMPTNMLPYSLRIKLIEADRISTPHFRLTKTPLMITDGKANNGNRIYDGVEVNDDGLVTAYYVSNNYPWEMTTDLTKWVRVEAYGEKTGLPNIIQVMDAERPDQYRGLSKLANVIEGLLQIRRYTESELMAALIESFFTAFIKTEADTSSPVFNETNSANQETLPDDENEYKMGPGVVNNLKVGESVDFIDPKRPNSGFQNFVRAISVQLGAALEVPADLLLKEFNSSYSAARAALLEAWKAFRMRREYFVSNFCRPVYERWMYEAVARERIIAPGFFDDPLARIAYLDSGFIGPSQGMLDPLKEITAEILACENGFSTRADSAIKINGSQWDSNVTQLKRENQQLAEATITNEVVTTLVKDTISEALTEKEKEEPEDGSKKQSSEILEYGKR